MLDRVQRFGGLATVCPEDEATQTVYGTASHPLLQW
jgi:hypothetical protein